MKIALIADTHFGARQDSLIFNTYFLKFFKDVFFPYIDEHHISTVFHLGDVFDGRKYINFHILNLVKKHIFDELQKRHIDVHILIGNHDTFYKTHSGVNSSQVLEGYDNITYYTSPTTIELDGLQMAMLPWINDGNAEETLNYIDKTDVKYAFGHLAIQGCELSAGVKNQEGLNRKLFKKFNQVYSGHFHHRNKYDNIQYVGAPYQITYIDLKDGKGFSVFDTDTKKLTLHKNPYEMFYTIDYNDALCCYDKIEEENFDYISGCYVKIVVVNKTNPYLYDRFVNAIEHANPARITIVEDMLDYTVTDEDITDLKEDTITVINREVDELLLTINKDKLKSIIKQLYIESLDEQ